MAERKFKPGVRKTNLTEGRISEERLAWLQTYIGQFVLMYYTKPMDEDAATHEEGPTLRLMLPTQRGRSMFYNITALTHEELVALKELFDMMFELAEPIIKDRDKAAQDAYDRGDDSFTRIYRQVPRLVVRPRALESDSEGVRERSNDPLEGDEVEGDSEHGVREDSLEVAEGDQGSSRGQDDDAKAD